MWAIGCMMAELIDGQPLFPGESDIDQIYCIQKTLGVFIPEHMEAFNKNKHFSGLKLPKITKTESIEKKYSEKIDKLGIQFINDLLQLNPTKRLTASEALTHPYFQGIIIDKRPQTSISVERGRSVLSTYYYNKNKNNIPNSQSPNNFSIKITQKKYKAANQAKKILTREIEKVRTHKKHMTVLSENKPKDLLRIAFLE